MEQVRRALAEANNAFRTADHLAYVSYPLLRDNRLLLAVAQNLYIAGLKGMDAVLHYETLYKRINVLPHDFESRMFIFESNVVKRMNIKKEVCKAIKDLKFTMNQHKESPIEFSRRNQFVICSEDYSTMQAISIEILKSYLQTLREFLNLANRLN